MDKSKKPKVSSQEARELLLKEQQERRQKCIQEVQAVLDKYGMQIQATAVVPANQVQIVPKVRR